MTGTTSPAVRFDLAPASESVRPTKVGVGFRSYGATSGYFEFKAQPIGANVTILAPNAYPSSNGQIIYFNTDGSSSFGDPPAAVIPAGTGTEIQYRFDATTFGAVSGSSFDGSILTVPQLISTGSIDFNFGIVKYQWFGIAGIASLAINEEVILSADGSTKAVGIGTPTTSAQLTVRASSSNNIASFRDSSNNEIVVITPTLMIVDGSGEKIRIANNLVEIGESSGAGFIRLGTGPFTYTIIMSGATGAIDASSFNGVTLTIGGVATQFLNGTGAYSTPDHGSIGGLGDDDHTQYVLLAGRSGGQTVIGGTGSGENLTLVTTSHATKGKVIFGAGGTTVFDGVNNRFGVGIAIPTATLDVRSAPSSGIPVLGARSTVDTTSATVEFYSHTGNPIFTLKQHPSTAASGLITNVTSIAGLSVISVSSGGAIGSSAEAISIVSGNMVVGYDGTASKGFIGTRLNAPFSIHTNYIERFLIGSSSAKFQGKTVSSTTAREQFEIEGDVIDNTDATRKYYAVHRVYDTAAREYMRGIGDGTNGRLAISTPNAAPTDSHIQNSQASLYVDQTAHNLLVRVKYSDGTLKLGTVALV